MTEPTRAELLAKIEQLEQDRLLYKGIFERSAIPIVLYSKDGKVMQANQAFQDFWQLPDGNASLKDVNILQDPQVIEAGLMHLMEQAFEGQVVTFPPLFYDIQEMQGVTGGLSRWAVAQLYPLLDAEGAVYAVVETNHDITEMKEKQDELEQLKAEHLAIIEAQQAAIQELSTPIIPIVERVIVMPLVGSITDARARDILRDLLRGITQHRAKIVILDITGVNSVDSEVIGHLDKSIQAARLKGAQTIVTGVSDAVAEAIIDLGIDWSTIETVNDLAGGLRLAISRVAT